MRFRFLVLCASLLFAGAVARAENPVQRHFLESNDSPQQEFLISPMFIVTPFGPQELGARASHQLWDDGFINALNDSISAEGSFFVGRWEGSRGLSTYLSTNMRWDFHLVREWTVFGAPGIAVYRHGSDDDWVLTPSLHLGGFWNIQPDLAIRADIEVEHLSPRVGLAFRY